MDSFDTQAVCYGDMTNARRMGTRTFNDLMDVMTEAIGSEGDRVTVVMTGEQRFTQDLATKFTTRLKDLSLDRAEDELVSLTNKGTCGELKTITGKCINLFFIFSGQLVRHFDEFGLESDDEEHEHDDLGEFGVAGLSDDE